MSEQPWETHHAGCTRRHSAVAYPRHVCEECRAFERGVQAARDAVVARMKTEPDIPRRTGMGYAVEEIDVLTQTSSTEAASLLSAAPLLPTSVAPAGEDHGAHVKPIYVDAWDGMAVPYDDHVVAVETAHAAGMREALADFLTSIDEDDPVYLRGHSVDIRDGIKIGRVMAAYDVGWLGAWSMRADALNLTDGTRLVRLNDAVKAARGDQS